MQSTDGLGGVTSFTYDQNGNVLTVQDPRSLTPHQFSYDSRNRVKTYTDPLGNVETYNYDGMGNLVSKLDRKNQTTTYEYDGLDRVKNITYADNSSITITWDAGNRPKQFIDTINGTITQQYDDLDRLTEEVSPQGQVDYQYDAAGRRKQLTVSGLSPVTYQYDNDNRLTLIAQGSTTVGLAYDAAGRRKGTTFPNGIVATYGYDDADELISMSYDQGSTHVGDLAYGYDLSGRQTGKSGSLANMLMPASVASATYDAANRLTSWGSTPLSYDNNGNLTAFGASIYGWNARDQLISTSDGGGVFSYDPFGRRTARTVSGSTTPYLHDGLNPATVSGSLMLDGPGLDEIYSRVSGSSTDSYLTDFLGSTLALTDASGATTGSYTYAPYGTASQTGTDDSSFQYTGRENDGATNLYYYRARYYSPALNRFVSQDPIGFGGGLNFYAYVRGNPVDEVDPSGLIDYPGFGFGPDQAQALSVTQSIPQFSFPDLWALLPNLPVTISSSATIPTGRIASVPTVLNIKFKKTPTGGQCTIGWGPGIGANYSLRYSGSYTPIDKPAGHSGWGATLSGSLPVYGGYGLNGSYTNYFDGTNSGSYGPTTVGGSPTISYTVGYTFTW